MAGRADPRLVGVQQVGLGMQSAREREFGQRIAAEPVAGAQGAEKNRRRHVGCRQRRVPGRVIARPEHRDVAGEVADRQAQQVCLHAYDLHGPGVVDLIMQRVQGRPQRPQVDRAVMAHQEAEAGLAVQAAQQFQHRARLDQRDTPSDVRQVVLVVRPLDGDAKAVAVLGAVA